MSTPKDYSSLKYIIQSTKEKQSSYSLPKDYSSQNKDRLFIPKKNLSTCELILSNENGLEDEEIYLDRDDLNELKNGFCENNEADLSDGSEASIDSSLISVPATISLLERLIRTHSIWLLTNLERSAVNRLLHNKEPGHFIVRNSSKPGTMALSVRLPKGKGPYIEHYLIENLGNRKLHLEGSERYFSVVPMLISHYCQCIDELPVKLRLPDIIINASRHQLNSLSLLCDKFWTTNFDEQIYSLSENDEPLIRKTTNGHQEENNNLVQKSSSRLSDGKLSLGDDDRNSVDAKDLAFDTEDDEDHNFVNKEVFSSESCDNQEDIKIDENQDDETEVKKHYLMDKDENNLDDEYKELANLEQNNKSTELEQNENQIEKPNIPTRPPRKSITQQISISPPPLNRNLKPMAKPQYFKLSTVNDSIKSNEESNRKKSTASNLNLLIDFDVLEEEEKLIEQLKENDIFNLNVINAQTQQLMSSQISNQLNSDSSSSNSNSPTRNEPLLNDQINITKIEVNTGVPSSDANKIQEKLDELNLIELKLNESKEELEDELQLASRTVENLIVENVEIEPLILQSTTVEPIELKPLIGQQCSQVQQMTLFDQEEKKLDKLNDQNEKMNNYEEIWQKPNVRPKQRTTKPKTVETRDCEVQTTAQTILEDLKLERYKNFLVYDCVPNLKLNNQLSKELSIFADPIYEERDLLDYQHFLKRNLSNPNLNQFNNNQMNKNTESHSFESLYVTYDSIYSKQTHFFERYIVPRDPARVSDVCLQVGDGLIKVSSRKNSIKTELINDERVKLAEEKKDVEWEVDHTWQFDSCSDDEDLTSLIVNNTENISTKYRRYSCKYIIESGVESDSDGEINEDGLQSMLNDNVRLDLNSASNQMAANEKNEIRSARPIKAIEIQRNEKTNSPNVLIDIEEPCSSGFYEPQQSISHNNKINELKPIDQHSSKVSTQLDTKIHLTKQRQIRNEETEDDEDMLVFQEIGLDDVYTTNDELDDNQSVDRLEEDIYTVTARNVTYSTVAKSISEYIFELYRLNDNVFAKSINNFIQCTKELYELNPLIIMRNIRQFINGMKNYLIKNGEKEFLDFVKHERKRLRTEEFLNLDAIITACLHKLVIKPLKEFIYQKFVAMEYTFGHQSFMKLNENISFLSTRLPEEFEIQNNVRLPNSKTMKRIAVFFSKLQSTYSPLKKLEYILSVVSIINFNTKIIDKEQIDGKLVINKQRIDERVFVSVFIYLLVKFNVVNIEIEIDYILSLLQSNLINGDAAYFLNMLSSCVYVLKCNFLICQERDYPLNTVELQRSMITSYLPSLNDSLNAKCKLSLFQKEISNNLVLPKIIDHPELSNRKNLKNSKKRNHTFNQNINELTLVNSNFVQSYPSALSNYRQDSFFRTQLLQNTNLPLKLSSLFTICCLKILLLDEFTGNINSKLIVIRPEMSAKEFVRLIAQKFAIFNCEDYSLFLLTQEGKEFQLDDNELPFSVKVNAIKYNMNLSFVFKRTDSQYVFSNKFYEFP